MEALVGFTLEAIPVRHVPILADHLPDMFAFLTDGRVLNPADSFSDDLLAFAGIELLLLPVTAPFLTELRVADFARNMKPKRILPVHDGYAKAFFLKQRYEIYGLFSPKWPVRFTR